MVENLNRVAIRSADTMTATKVERQQNFAKSDEVVARQKIETMKMETKISAFMFGTRPESKDYAQLERLAIMTQQHERICEQLKRDAERKLMQERNICVVTVMLTLLSIALAAWFVVNVRP
jgi:hypothetical protein